MRRQYVMKGIAAAAPLVLLAGCGGGAGSADGDEASTEDVELAEACPRRGADLRGNTEPLTCSCSPDDAGYGVVFGSNPYHDDSGMCGAAMHAGFLNDGPANITVTWSETTDQELTGTEANGITSAPYISSDEPPGVFTLE